MRKVSATFIISGNQPPLRNGILIFNDNGTIIDLIDTKGNLTEQAGLEYYSGVVVPGFVNTYCKLELNLLNEITPQFTDSKGLSNYLNNLEYPLSDIAGQSINRSNLLMQQAGIGAAGDSSLSTLTIPTKKKSSIYYHTFIETFGEFSSQSDGILLDAQRTEKEFQKADITVSLTPHSFYSASPELLLKIWNNARDNKSILAVVNSCFTEKNRHSSDGKKFDQERQLNSDDLAQKLTTINKLPLLTNENRFILVHDYELQEFDFSIIKRFNAGIKTYLVLCPESILSSCGSLHSVTDLLTGQLNICLGTGGKNSNNRWSVLNEMIVLQTQFPELTLQQLVEWACRNGAEALGTGSELGSFEKGKNPGINLLTGVDLQQLRLRPDSKVKVLQKAQKNNKVQ